MFRFGDGKALNNGARIEDVSANPIAPVVAPKFVIVVIKYQLRFGAPVGGLLCAILPMVMSFGRHGGNGS